MDVEIIDDREGAPIYGDPNWDRCRAYANVYMLEWSDRAVYNPAGVAVDYRACWKARLCTIFREHETTQGMRCLPVLAAAGGHARRFGSVLPVARHAAARTSAEQYVIQTETGFQERHFITKVISAPTEPTREVRVFICGDNYYGVEKVGNFLTAATSI